MLARDIIEENAEHQKHLGERQDIVTVVKPIQEKFIELQNQMNKFYGDEREQLELDRNSRSCFPSANLRAEAKHSQTP